MSHHARWTFLILLAALFLIVPACGGGGGGGSTEGTHSATTTPPGEDPPPEDPPPTEDPPPVHGTSMSDQEAAMALEVLGLVNDERAAEGLDPLAWHSGAAEVSYQHSVDMDVRDFWNNGYPHIDPDGNGPGERLADAGIVSLAWGENIAIGYATPEAVVQAWMDSPGHRANIMNPIFTHLGNGLHFGDYPGSYWTQVFLRLPH